jgi:hypothetical protein
MRYIKVKCMNKGCPNYGQEYTAPAGQPFAPGIIQLAAALECEGCGEQPRVERA